MKWSRFLLLACAFAVHAETHVIDDLGVEAQKRSQWCWASVSTMSIRSFDEEGDFHHLSQVQVVARRRAGANNLVEAAVPAIAEKIGKLETKCAKPGKCNRAEVPLLFDIESDSPATGEALSMAAIAHDIKEMEHPIIIRWVYSEDADAHPDAGEQRPQSNETRNRAGAHALLITGYDDETMEIRVFDPLPMGSTAIAKHQKWISFDHYLNPEDLEGIRVEAFHVADQYRMRRTGVTPAGMNHYPKVAATPQSSPPPAPGGFEPLRNLDPAIRKYMGSRVFRQSSGESRTGSISFGKPFPIVALRSADLMRAKGQPDTLLAPRTATYVVPVLENGTVVDSFLLLKKGHQWVPGGYSNNQIASLVEQIRAERGNGRMKPEAFYLVSIPELSAFYAAHGFNAQAKLISLDNDGRGEFVAAKQVLGELISVAERDAEEAIKGDDDVDPKPRPISPR